MSVLFSHTTAHDYMMTHNRSEIACTDWWQIMCTLPVGAEHPVSMHMGRFGKNITTREYEKAWFKAHGYGEHERQEWKRGSGDRRGRAESATFFERFAKTTLYMPSLEITKPSPLTDATGDRMWSPQGFIWIGFSLYCVLFLLVNVANLIRNGFYNCCDGGYLAFTWQLEEMEYYKIMARSMCVVTIGLPSLILPICMVFMPGLYLSVLPALWKAKFDVVTALVGLVPMVVLAPGHAYAYHTEEFKATRFKRPWALVVQTNDVFGQMLGDALINHRRGDATQLQALCDSPANVVQLAFQEIEESASEQAGTPGLLENGF